MTERELTGLLTERFYDGFADKIAGLIGNAEDAELLYDLVTMRSEPLSRNVRHKVCFRGAYVLERIYFGDRSRFKSFAERFCREDFAACTDPSTRRHFAKIMSDLLGSYMPDPESLDGIAGAAAEWAVDPGTKVAVKIWAVEILKCCRTKVGWVAESWDDILEAVAHDATPGIACRMRKNWK